MKLCIEQIAYHRNGVGGEPFYVVTFKDEEDPRDVRSMVGVVFPDDHGNFAIPDHFTNPRTAVFDRTLLGEGVITFGVNSHRGDRYDNDLRAAIIEHEARERAAYA